RRIVEGKRNLLAQAGCGAEPITCLVAQDIPITKTLGDITADLLKRLGMTVDFVATDWGTVGARRAVKTPPGQGGWHMFHTWHSGSGCINPAPYIAIRATVDKAWVGCTKSGAADAGAHNRSEAKTVEEQNATASPI